MQEPFWQISSRNLSKAAVRSCVKCFRVNPKAVFNSIMANLPKNRVTLNLPFRIIGIDYVGYK